MPTVPPIAPPIARPRPVAVARRGSPIATGILGGLVALLLGLVALVFLYCSACFDQHFNAGQWLDLGAGIVMISFLPFVATVCVVFALILRARCADRTLSHAAIVLAFLLGCPLTAFPLAKAMSGTAASFLGPYKERAERERQAREMVEVQQHNEAQAQAVARHYEALRARFREPQQVARIEHGLIILDDGAVLSLWGVGRDEDMMLRLKRGEAELRAGGDLRVRLPERQWFERDYEPEPASEPWPHAHAETFATAPVDAEGWRYGKIPVLVFLDGRLINSRFADKSSFGNFKFYETWSPREE